MRRFVLLAGALFALAAAAQALNGITVVPATRFEFTDCAAGGSAAQSLTRNTYLFRVTTEDVWICMAATCAAGGEKFGGGVAFLWSVGATTSFSCRSAGATGDAIFTKVVTP